MTDAYLGLGELERSTDGGRCHRNRRILRSSDRSFSSVSSLASSFVSASWLSSTLCAKRGKKATSGTQAAAPASHVHGPSPALWERGVERYALRHRLRPPLSAPAPAPTPSSASLNPPQPTPRDTGFAGAQVAPDAHRCSPWLRPRKAPKRRRSRKDHRPRSSLSAPHS